MLKVLIDTDVAIDFLRGDHQAKKFIEPLWTYGEAYLSLLSVYELHAGMKESEAEYTQSFISVFRLLQLTFEVVKEAGDYYRFHRSHGLTLTAIDCMIYITAKHNNFKLLTRNLKHYPDKEILFKV
jgi:predicted nucleic acid-binding protein